MTRFRIHRCLIIVVFAFAKSTIGQTIAPAISSDDLAQYAQILRLSDAQFRAVDPLYQQYLEQWRAYDRDHVTPFDAAELPDGAYQDRAILQRTYDEIAALRRGIDPIDDAFFSSILPILSDQQMPIVDAVALLRLRQRLFTRLGGHPIGFMFADCHMEIELRRALLDVDVSHIEWQAIEPLLVAHERQVTQWLTELATARHKERWFGHLDGSPWYVVQGRHTPLGNKIRCAHRRTLEQIALLLDQNQARMLRDDVLSRLYPGITPDPEGVDRYFDRLTEQAMACSLNRSK